MSSVASHPNIYLSAALGPLLAKTALPMMIVMSLSGLLNVVDAIFLGVFVGAGAVGAVTTVFPLTLLLIALSTLVASGMSSLLARRLGSGAWDGAQRVFAAAHGLAATISLGLMATFWWIGRPLSLIATAGDPVMEEMAFTYMGISVAAAPLMFLLALHADGLRNEGRASLMAAMSLVATLANVVFNYGLIAVLELGVAGSAYGTAAAQALALVAVGFFRWRGATPLRLSVLRACPWWGEWGRMISLGAPQSLSFVGPALVSATVIAAVQSSGRDGYTATIAAYGIITRIFGLAFLALVGLAQAMQAIVGNNIGAGQYERSDTALRYALIAAGLYCLAVEAALVTFAGPMGAAFVEDAAVVSEVGRILPQMVLAYLLSGPVLILAFYFQSAGDARRAALLALTKPFLFTPALILCLAAFTGEQNIWIAPALSDVLMACLALVLLYSASRLAGQRKGLFLTTREAAS